MFSSKAWFTAMAVLCGRLIAAPRCDLWQASRYMECLVSCSAVLLSVLWLLW